MVFEDRSPDSRVRRRARRRVVFTVASVVISILLASGVVMVLGRW